MPPSWASKTLQLPRSTLPFRALLSERPKYLKQVTEDLYAWQKEHCQGRFVLHDGPPYANGDLHIGHALNKILKDITCRYRVSQGQRVEFRPGWDCHGLPIELKALQKQKELGNSDEVPVNPSQIRQLARRLAKNTVELQKEQFQEWAVMADWKYPWRTMDKDYELRQLEIFKLMVANGQIYRRCKPVYWSTSSRTALAEAELEYNSNHKSKAAYVKFQLNEIPDEIAEYLPGGTEASVSLAVWTTTPWTLPANRLIGVRKNGLYSILQTTGHGIIIVVKARVAEFLKICPTSKIIGHIDGAKLIGHTYLSPFPLQTLPRRIIHAEFVTDDSGTGVVHIAPGHGMDDYRISQHYNVEPFAPVNDAGLFTHEALPELDLLAGKNVLDDGNEAVLAVLEGAGMLVHKHDYWHKYPYDWRSKKPVIIRATEQWFADLSNIRQEAMHSLQHVRFIPASSRDRLASFLKDRSEWCISRQRAWGVPIPALYLESGEAILTAESISHIISVIRERGIDAWWSDDPTDPAWILPSIRNGGRLRRGTDTMDVWFDSGTSWSEMQPGPNQESTQIADIFLEGTDQHRGWFQSSLLTKVAQLAAQGKTAAQAPFKTLITHGFTLDHKGKKMSKSEGNVVSPSQIMNGTLLPPPKIKGKTDKIQGPIHDGMGPDALRLWVASSDFTHDVVIGEPILKAINDSLAKLRRTYKLLAGLLDTYDLKHKISFSDLRQLDQLAVIQSRKMKALADKSYEEFAYQRVVTNLTSYVNTDLSAFYIESIKDRCYVDAESSESSIHAQAVLWEIYRNLSAVLSPITPLLVAEARDHLPEQLQSYDPFRSLKEEVYASILGVAENENLELLFQDSSSHGDIRKIWTSIKETQEVLRNAGKIGSSLDSWVTIQIPQEPRSSEQSERLDRIRTQIKAFEPELPYLFIVSKVDVILSQETLQFPGWVEETSPEDDTLGIKVYVHQPQDLKCVRCWKYNVPETLAATMEEAVCERCLDVLDGQRENDGEDVFEGRPKMAAIAKQVATKREMIMKQD